MIHVRITFIFQVTGSSSTSSSSSPCHSCGAARSKATKGCTKGQKATGKNPLSSKAADGLVDVATQTTFKFKEVCFLYLISSWDGL